MVRWCDSSLRPSRCLHCPLTRSSLKLKGCRSSAQPPHLRNFLLQPSSVLAVIVSQDATCMSASKSQHQINEFTYKGVLLLSFASNSEWCPSRVLEVCLQCRSLTNPATRLLIASMTSGCIAPVVGMPMPITHVWDPLRLRWFLGRWRCVFGLHLLDNVSHNVKQADKCVTNSPSRIYIMAERSLAEDTSRGSLRGVCTPSSFFLAMACQFAIA